MSLHATAQPAPQPPDAIDAAENPGQLTARTLRAEIRTLERDMFELFNTLNTNDEFDVTCGYHTPTGSKIPLWQCEPAFMQVAESAEFMQMNDNRSGPQTFGGFGYLPREQDDLAFVQREKAEQMQAELKALALENPELASAIMKLHARRLQLAELETATEE